MKNENEDEKTWISFPGRCKKGAEVTQTQEIDYSYTHVSCLCEAAVETVPWFENSDIQSGRLTDTTELENAWSLQDYAMMHVACKTHFNDKIELKI